MERYSLLTMLQENDVAPVVQKVDNAIHRINHYPLDIIAQLVLLAFIHWIVIYLVDSAIHALTN